MFLYPYFATDKMQLIIPPIFFHLVALSSTICASNFMPLYYLYKSDHTTCKATFEQFVEVLQYPSFRNKFYLFLTEQFCGENLQFYETVMVWKQMGLGDERRRTCAQLIYDNFVKDDGICQVNVMGITRDKIVEDLQQTHISSDIFDDACSSIIQDMFANSFLHFRSTHEFKETTSIELM
jgi:hypothetical protein